MDSKNKNIINTSDSFTNDFKEKIKLRVSDKFDPTVIGKIDLVEAEEIAKEEGLFFTENDIMEGLEDFELIPIKPGKEFKTEITQETRSGLDLRNIAARKDNAIESNKIANAANNESDDGADKSKQPIDDVIKVESAADSLELNTIDEILDSELIISEEDKIAKEGSPEEISDSSDDFVIDLEQTEQPDEVSDKIKEIIPDDKIRIIEELEDHEVLLIDERTFIQKNNERADFDSFVAERSQRKSEISEVLGLIPEESDYINDKLFGEFYKKSAYNIAKDKANARDVIKDEASLVDITDEIVILEDKEKLLEFTSEFPGKSDHLVKLLSYLDGLFEKLPEDVIRKFAESEYFDLYSKILKDMDM